MVYIDVQKKKHKTKKKTINEKQYLDEGESVIILFAESEQKRNEWITLIKYAMRNVKENTTITRTPGDPLRGNRWLSGMMERIDELVDENKQIKREVKKTSKDVRMERLEEKITNLMRENEELRLIREKTRENDEEKWIKLSNSMQSVSNELMQLTRQNASLLRSSRVGSRSGSESDDAVGILRRAERLNGIETTGSTAFDQSTIMEQDINMQRRNSNNSSNSNNGNNHNNRRQGGGKPQKPIRSHNGSGGSGSSTQSSRRSSPSRSSSSNSQSQSQSQSHGKNSNKNGTKSNSNVQKRRASRSRTRTTRTGRRKKKTSQAEDDPVTTLAGMAGLAVSTLTLGWVGLNLFGNQ